MNIFFLHSHPAAAARLLCNRHVVKMIVETFQLLYAAHHAYNTTSWRMRPYRATHVNHPMGRWVRLCAAHYDWTVRYASALLEVYSDRYPGRVHKCLAHLDHLRALGRPRGMPRCVTRRALRREFGPRLATQFPPSGCLGAPLCMGEALDECLVPGKTGYDLLASYRSYYARKASQWARAGRPMSWATRSGGARRVR